MSEQEIVVKLGIAFSEYHTIMFKFKAELILVIVILKQTHTAGFKFPISFCVTTLFNIECM